MADTPCSAHSSTSRRISTVLPEPEPAKIVTCLRSDSRASRTGSPVCSHVPPSASGPLAAVASRLLSRRPTPRFGRGLRLGGQCVRFDPAGLRAPERRQVRRVRRRQAERSGDLAGRTPRHQPRREVDRRLVEHDLERGQDPEIVLAPGQCRRVPGLEVVDRLRASLAPDHAPLRRKRVSASVTLYSTPGRRDRSPDPVQRGDAAVLLGADRPEAPVRLVLGVLVERAPQPRVQGGFGARRTVLAEGFVPATPARWIHAVRPAESRPGTTVSSWSGSNGATTSASSSQRARSARRTACRTSSDRFVGTSGTALGSLLGGSPRCLSSRTSLFSRQFRMCAVDLDQQLPGRELGGGR